MANAGFPEMITKLPEADVPFKGVRAWISQASDHQVVFLDIEPVGHVSAHRHGEQWGVVVEGELELTIGGVAHHFKAGDSYHIPAGVEHAARFLARTRVVDVFADVDRYRPKK
jgi:quercetin dioxygenase-like cupin family protein